MALGFHSFLKVGVSTFFLVIMDFKESQIFNGGKLGTPGNSYFFLFTFKCSSGIHLGFHAFLLWNCRKPRWFSVAMVETIVGLEKGGFMLSWSLRMSMYPPPNLRKGTQLTGIAHVSCSENLRCHLWHEDKFQKCPF